MDLHFLPRSLMIFGALLAVLGGVFYLVDKRKDTLAKLYDRQWTFYLLILAFAVVSLILTIVVNGIWHA
jgi:hypothetical protein